MSAAARTHWNVAGSAAGFGISFFAFGLLWIGVPWKFQFLVALPALLVAYVISRLGAVALSMLIGMAPIGAIVVQFRDKDDSHLMPVLLVLSWAAAVVLGHYLAKRSARDTPP